MGEANGDDNTTTLLDFTPDEDLQRMAVARNISNSVQKLRKEAKLQQDDKVDVWVDPLASSNVAKVLVDKREYIDSLLRKPLWPHTLMQGHEVIHTRQESELEGEKFAITITVRGAYFNADALKALTDGDAQADACCRQYLQTFSIDKLTKICDGKDPVKVNFGGKAYQLKPKTHFVFG